MLKRPEKKRAILYSPWRPFAETNRTGFGSRLPACPFVALTIMPSDSGPAIFRFPSLFPFPSFTLLFIQRNLVFKTSLPSSCVFFPICPSVNACWIFCLTTLLCHRLPSSSCFLVLRLFMPSRIYLLSTSVHMHVTCHVLCTSQSACPPVDH